METKFTDVGDSRIQVRDVGAAGSDGITESRDVLRSETPWRRPGLLELLRWCSGVTTH